MRILNSRKHPARTLAVTCGSAALLLCAAAPTPAEPNASVTRFAGPFDLVTTDICPFPVADHGYQEGTLSIRDTAKGTLFSVSAREQDTFSANGVSLTSNWYAYHFEGLVDAHGDVVRQTTSGVLVNVPLPDGSTFFSAGRVDMLASGSSFVTVPDVGTSRGKDAFCAALSG